MKGRRKFDFLFFTNPSYLIVYTNYYIFIYKKILILEYLHIHIYMLHIYILVVEILLRIYSTTYRIHTHTHTHNNMYIVFNDGHHKGPQDVVGSVLCIHIYINNLRLAISY